MQRAGFVPRCIYYLVAPLRFPAQIMAGVIHIGVAGMAVMGQNLALNIASKGFPCAVYNRSSKKVCRASRGGL